MHNDKQDAFLPGQKMSRLNSTRKHTNSPVQIWEPRESFIGVYGVYGYQYPMHTINFIFWFLVCLRFVGFSCTAPLSINLNLSINYLTHEVSIYTTIFVANTVISFKELSIFPGCNSTSLPWVVGCFPMALLSCMMRSRAIFTCWTRGEPNKNAITRNSQCIYTYTLNRIHARISY